jgi:hypothetical protein
VDLWKRVLDVTDTDGPFTITHHELGWFPDQLGNHQISVNGLDGGTYDVSIRTPGDDTFQVHQPDVAEADTVIIDKPVAAAFQLTFSGLGGAAEPRVTISGWPRRNG